MYSVEEFIGAFHPFVYVVIAGAVVIAAMLLWNCLKPEEKD